MYEPLWRAPMQSAFLALPTTAIMSAPTSRTTSLLCWLFLLLLYSVRFFFALTGATLTHTRVEVAVRQCCYGTKVGGNQLL